MSVTICIFILFLNTTRLIHFKMTFTHDVSYSIIGTIVDIDYVYFYMRNT